MTVSKPRAERCDRVNWLRANPEVLKLSRMQVVTRMKQTGLVRPTTQPIDVNLYNLLRDAGYSRRQCARFSRAPHLHGIEATQ